MVHLDLSRALAGELTAAGVIADNDQKNFVSARISWRGTKLFEDLESEFGEGVTELREQFVSGLGMGAVAAEFVTAPVPVTPACRRALADLGGLLILSVTAFDRVLDSGRPPPEVRYSATPVSPPVHGGPLEAWLPSIQTEYFRRLDRLPQRQPAIRTLADSIMRRMYAAELGSVSPQPASRSTWWRKNVLPIVMLGLPAWIAADPFHSSSFFRHLMWLARLGEFFGWVDDCVDHAEDVILGQANRIDFRLRSTSREHLVHWIAAQGKRVLAQWDLASGPPALRSTFAVIVWSWIENQPARAGF